MTNLAAVQRATCKRFGAPYAPVSDAQLCAVFDGVYEGDAVQGVRYSAPEHMSGWYITHGAIQRRPPLAARRACRPRG